MSRILMIFAKAPVPGQSKTRLIPMLGAQGAADLQAQLLRHVVAELSDPRWQVQLWCAPDCSHPLFVELAERYGMTLHQQQGGHLGERMAHAFDQALAQGGQVVIVGADCPAINRELVEKSFEILEKEQKVVIAPAEDGGYVMLGLNRPMRQIFAALPWGSGQVLAATEQILRTQQVGYVLQPVLWDVDREQDVLRLRAEISGFA